MFAGLPVCVYVCVCVCACRSRCLCVHAAWCRCVIPFHPSHTVCYHGNLSLAALKRMLNLNTPLSKSSVAVEPVWKVNSQGLHCAWLHTAPFELADATCHMIIWPRPLIVTHLLQVLIYDKNGSDIISPLLTVKDLRGLGVTLHMWVGACN